MHISFAQDYSILSVHDPGAVFFRKQGKKTAGSIPDLELFRTQDRTRLERDLAQVVQGQEVLSELYTVDVAGKPG